MKLKLSMTFLLLTGLLCACNQDNGTTTAKTQAGEPAAARPAVKVEPPSQFGIYARVQLSADLSRLSDQQKQMISLLIDAARISDDIFWQQVWGDKDALLDGIKDPKIRKYAEINYGPWDHLAEDRPFIKGYGPRPPGARFYPQDMTKAEFEAWNMPGKDGQYSIVRRGPGGLTLVPYSAAYGPEINDLARLLLQAGLLAEDPDFGNYLKLRAAALQSDDYQASDMAWMDMKHNPIELVIGPIESYQDQLFGYRTAFEGFVLLKDQAWSEKLARFAKFMPDLQRGLPVPPKYKAEMPGSNADLNAYDLLYCAGDCNYGAKTIAINLPNDEKVQLSKGTRRLQLKNVMLAKFNKIMLPITNTLITADQRKYVTFDAFFQNTMFHEVAHGLGIANTLDGKGTVRQALKEHYSALEEGKADILGLYMVQRLRDMGEIKQGELMDNYVTFLAGIFRSVRFGASDAHGRANMIRFNYFKEAGAFSRDTDSGTYRVNVPAFEKAVKGLSHDLLVLQGNGDYDAVDKFVAAKGHAGKQLRADLKRLDDVNIPVDIVYQQGKKVLGLE